MKKYEILIGEKLKELRERKGYSLQDVADIMKIGKSTLHGYEKGRNSLTAKRLIELLTLYDADVDKFVHDVMD